MSEQPCTVVVGASRGLGQGVADVLLKGGHQVVAISRTPREAEPEEGLELFSEVLGDATEATMPARIIESHRPDNIVISAGAVPTMTRLQDQSWETFSATWQADVQICFHWVREALTAPLGEGSKVIVFSSGAALGGSPLSGGYAGAKATQRFITDYARRESKKEGLGVGFTSLMSKFSPETGVGLAATTAYAEEAGVPRERFLESNAPLLTPADAGAAVAGLLGGPAADLAASYLLDGHGLHAL